MPPPPGNPTKYTDLFVDAAGKPKPWPVEVPNSCIESAEYAMQCINSRSLLSWTVGESRSPNIIATFGNGRKLNISTDDVIQFASSYGAVLTDYPFTHLPKVGRGIMLLHKKNLTQQIYHMHCVATLASWGSNPKTCIMVTAMGERLSGVKMAALAVEYVTNIADFRDAWFGSTASEYAVGLLTHEKDNGPSH